MRRPAGRTFQVGAVLLLALGAGGCGNGGSDAPPQVTVHIGSETIQLEPTQYCADGEGHLYKTRPPIVQAAPKTQVVFTVPEAVAQRGWQVQVFDEKLKNRLGSVAVAKGKVAFNEITTSDVVPPAFYLVVVEDKNGQCHDVSGAWPVGIIRAGDAPATGSMPAPSNG